MTPQPFDPLAPGAMDAAVLLAARVAALVLVAPVFSSTTVPKMVRAALIVLLTVVMLPLVGGVKGELTVSSFVSESLVGFAMGLGAAFTVSAAETAGDLLATQTGLSGATTLDPMSNASTAALSEFFRLVVITLMLALGGHLLMLEALARSVREIPIGSPIHTADGLAALVHLGSILFVLGLRFAAPVVAAVLISNLALGILARTVPQLNALAVAYPVQIMVGLVTLAAALPVIAGFMLRWPGHYAENAGQLLGIFAHGAR